MMKLTPENKATWLEALDTHSKTKCSLVATTDNCSSYCCLGVAGKVLLGLSDDDLEKESEYITNITNVVNIEKDFNSTYTHLEDVLLQNAAVDDRMLAYINEFCLLEDFRSATIETFLAYLNDRTDTFKEVKDFITKYL